MDDTIGKKHGKIFSAEWTIAWLLQDKVGVE